MPTYIAKTAQSPRTTINLEKPEYDEALNAVRTMKNLISIETLYRIVIENFIQLEISLLEHSYRFMCCLEDEAMHYFKERIQFEKNISSVLSTCRMYLDQVDKASKRLDSYCGSDIRKCFNQERSNQYDNCLSYRFMEGLRNSTQHRCMSVGLIMPGWKRRVIDKREYSEFTTQIEFDITHLGENGDIKKTVLDELKTLDNFDLRHHTRAYMDSIYEIHKNVRIASEMSASKSEKVVSRIHKKLLQSGAASLLGAQLYELDDRGCKIDETGIAESFVQVLKTSRRTCAAIPMKSSFVSSFTALP